MHLLNKPTLIESKDFKVLKITTENFSGLFPTEVNKISTHKLNLYPSVTVSALSDFHTLDAGAYALPEFDENITLIVDEKSNAWVVKNFDTEKFVVLHQSKRLFLPISDYILTWAQL